jgi:tetratricopeptide (TPR) repeat protein
MGESIEILTSWGDKLLITYSSGLYTANLANANGKIVLSDIEVHGIADIQPEELKSLNYKLLQLRFKLSRYNDRMILAYSSGLKGGGACISKHKKGANSDSTTTSGSRLNLAMQKDDIIGLNSDRLSDPKEAGASDAIPIDKKAIQQQVSSYIKTVKKGIESNEISKIKTINDLYSIQPSHLLRPEIASINLMKILLLDCIWAECFYTLRPEIARLARRYLFCYFMQNYESLNALEREENEILEVLGQVKDKVMSNRSFIGDDGLLVEVLAIESVFMNISDSKNWCISAIKKGPEMIEIYSNENTSSSVSLISIAYKRLRGIYNRNYLTLMSFIDTLDLRTFSKEEYDECLDRLYRDIIEFGWKELYYALSFLERAAINDKCSIPFLFNLLKYRFRPFWTHKSIRIKRRISCILNILRNHTDAQIKEISDILAKRIRESDQDPIISYILSHPSIMIEASFIFLPNSTTPTSKLSLNNLKPFNSGYVGRNQELETIAQELLKSKTFCSIKVAGPDGIGKTRLAHQFALQRMCDYDVIWWVNSESKISFDESLLNLAIMLNLEPINLKKVAEYLENPNISKLLILDNIERTDFITTFLPSSGHYIYLFRTVPNYAVDILLSPLESQDSVELLSQNHISAEVDRATLSIFSNVLQGFPFLIIQGSTIFKQSNTTLHELIKSLSDISDINSIFSEILSFNINQITEELRYILYTVAMISSEEIPYELLLSIFKDRYGNTSIIQFNSYIRELIGIGILNYNISNMTFTIYRVLHDSLRRKLNVEEAIIASSKNYFVTFYNYNTSQNPTPHKRRMLKLLTPHIKMFIEINKDFLDDYSLAILYSQVALILTFLHHNSDQALRYINLSFNLLNTLNRLDHRIAEALSNIGILYKFVSNLKKAEQVFKKLITVGEKLSYQECLGNAYNELGLVHLSMSAYSKAEDCFKKSRDIKLSYLAPEHPDMATTYNNLGLVYSCKGSYEKAEDLLLKSKEIRIKLFSPDSPQLITIFNNLGELYLHLGDYAQAEMYLNLSKEIKSVSSTKNSREDATIFNNLGLLYRAKGDFEQAEEYFLKTNDILQETSKNAGIDIARNFHNLAGLYQGKKDWDRAEDYYIKSIDIYQKLAPDSISLASTYHNLASMYYTINKYKKAEDYYNASKNIRERTLGTNNLSLANTLYNLGILHYTQENYKTAELHFLRCKEIRVKLLPSEDPILLDTYKQLMALYQVIGQTVAARIYSQLIIGNPVKTISE